MTEYAMIRNITRRLEIRFPASSITWFGPTLTMPTEVHIQSLHQPYAVVGDVLVIDKRYIRVTGISQQYTDTESYDPITYLRGLVMQPLDAIEAIETVREKETKTTKV